MKRKTIIASLLLNAVMVHATAQETTCHFYSLEYLSINCQDEEEAGDMHEQTDSTMHITQERMSVEEIESLIAYYENKIATRDSLADRKSHVSKPKVFSYAEWTPRELNLENLNDVLGEVGLSNKLFVLAQAVLETGNFSSHVCKEYNNLFGLYDSKRRDYYRFASWEDSVVGYKRMIQYRYQGGNYLHFLKRIGYAENPRSISQVARIARRLYKSLFPD